MAININGHRGYPRKCPAAQQNIQEHIRSCVWIEFENIKTRIHKWLYVVKMSITQLYWYCTNLPIFLLYSLILTWSNFDQMITFAWNKVDVMSIWNSMLIFPVLTRMDCYLNPSQKQYQIPIRKKLKIHSELSLRITRSKLTPKVRKLQHNKTA